MKCSLFHLMLVLSIGSALRSCAPENPDPEATFAGIEFVRIDAGTFFMGSTKTAEELSAIYGDRVFYFESEQPRHEVTLSKAFWMGRYEVTQAQWNALMESNPSAYPGDDRPVDQVTWDECQVFIERLNQLGEGVFRLPTEAEWEYACRAGTDTEFSYGDDLALLPDYCWFWDNSGYQTHPVGLKLPNAWGLYDMHGNVFEWCQDWYDETYYESSPELDPQGPEEGRYKVRRGGTYGRVGSFCRSAFRFWNRPDYRTSTVGLRLVREMDEP